MVHINLFPRNNQFLNGMQAFSFYRKKLFPTLLRNDAVDASSANVHPCTFADGEFLLCKNIAAAWNHRHPRPKMYVRVLLFRCTSLYIGKGRVSAMPKLAAAYSYGHPCPF